MKKRNVTVHLDADLKARLDAAAKKQRCSISYIVRQLIDENLPALKRGKKSR